MLEKLQKLRAAYSTGGRQAADGNKNRIVSGGRAQWLLLLCLLQIVIDSSVLFVCCCGFFFVCLFSSNEHEDNNTLAAALFQTSASCDRLATSVGLFADGEFASFFIIATDFSDLHAKKSYTLWCFANKL